MQKSPADIALTIIINALRFTLALVFAFSGFVKAVDPMGTIYKMADYAEAFDLSLPFGLLFAGAVVLIICEYVMGICLFFGLYRRFYLSAMIAFLAVVTPLTLYFALYNPVSDCGCFGDVVVLTNWQTFIKNVVLLVMALAVLLGRKRVCRIISPHSQWLVFVYVVASIVAFIPYNLRHLPTVDFRPYHIGANIIESMTVSEDATPDEYETLFILEKDGEVDAFTFDNYPDSSWTFVSRESRLVSKGDVPAITDFYLSSLDGEDVTWDVLEHPGYTFLMIAHNLEYTSEGMLDVINDLFDYAKVNDVPFYMVTSSGRQAIDAWTESTGASYPYLLADETLLKTIVRANPGLLILEDATVIGKWSAADMPRDAQLTLPIEQNDVLRQSTRYMQGRIAKVALWMFLPLLLLLVMDKKKVNKKDISSINNLKT